MNPIEKILQQSPVMILDGAMATELENVGCDLNDSLWSAKVLIENPELIKRVHMDYFEAGADCAITASYQATIEGYKERGLTEQEAIELIQKSVVIAREARDEFWELHKQDQKRPKPLVAASVGPYGAFLSDGSEYRGDYAIGEDELMTFHRNRMKALVEAGADLLACETIPCLLEAKAIVKVMKEFPQITAWIAFSARDGQHICDGEKIAECAKWLHTQEQVAAIGINCTSPNFVPSLLKEIQAHTTKPIVLYPNSGEQYDPTDKTWQASNQAHNYCQLSKQWHEAGARLIGGCCRTTPEDIRAIASWARK